MAVAVLDFPYRRYFCSFWGCGFLWFGLAVTAFGQTPANLETLNLPSATSESASSPQEISAAKVGGDFRVIKAERHPQGFFTIEFQATKPTGRFDHLVLESDHLHVAIKVGQEVRLSAEIRGWQGDKAEVTQLVLFLPGREGHVPLWVLSRKDHGRALRAIPYLEMHVPANDYTVF